jgi:hypothetical protein
MIKASSVAKPSQQYTLHDKMLRHVRFNVNLILGAEGAASSSIAERGGLVARGEETAGNPNELAPGRLNPIPPNPPPMGEALAAEVEGVGGTGAVPLLNSAQRGHLRLVSVNNVMSMTNSPRKI